jgi:hypothetical protein
MDILSTYREVMVMGSLFVNLMAFMAGGYLVEQKYVITGILLFAVLSIGGSLVVSCLHIVSRRVVAVAVGAMVSLQRAL